MSLANALFAYMITLAKICFQMETTMEKFDNVIF